MRVQHDNHSIGQGRHEADPGQGADGAAATAPEWRPGTAIRQAAARSFRYCERQVPLVGVLSPIFLLAYLGDQQVAEPTYDSLLLRALAMLVLLPLALYRPGRTRQRSLWAGYWLFAITIAGPFMFGSLLVLNAATTPAGAATSSFWVIQYLIAVFVFTMFVSHIGLSLLLWTLASAGAFATLLWVEPVNWLELKQIFLYPIGAFVTAIVLGAIANRNSAIVQTEKTLAASAIGTSVAHELRTPLASIRNLAQAADANLGTLAEGYRRAVAAGLVPPELTPTQQQKLGDVLHRISREVEFSNTIIDMLLISTADLAPEKMLRERFTAADLIQDAIQRFPFNNSAERNLVQCEIQQDFNIEGARILLVHVLFNLLKNSLTHGRRSRAFQISIVVSTQAGQGVIRIEDNGGGIPVADQKKIFNRFYTTADSGKSAGIGLSFCRQVMTSQGGTVLCESDAQIYTRMLLKFPLNRT